MSQTTQDLLYRRGNRWWGDFRAFGDVGGKREPLRPEGQAAATEDVQTAEALASARLEELEWRRADAEGAGRRGALRLTEAVERYLDHLHRFSPLAEDTLTNYRYALERGLGVLAGGLGEREGDPYLHRFDALEHGLELRSLLGDADSRRTGQTGLSSRTQRLILKLMQEVFEWSIELGYLAPGTPNPMGPALRRFRVTTEETDWLEEHEAAAFLEALLEVSEGMEPPVMLSFLWALTGMRPSAGAGTEVREIDPGRGVIRVRCNRWRSIKGRRKGHRAVPIWPQLDLALRVYQAEHRRIGAVLLCPTVSTVTGEETMITDVRKRYLSAKERAIQILDEAGHYHELRDKRITRRSWRTTYASARVQTVEGGVPVAKTTVQRELGHQSELMLDRVYARIGDPRYRARRQVVEYRLPGGRLAGERLFRARLGEQVTERLAGAGRPVDAATAAERLGTDAEAAG